jgi:hypothetical protein
MSTVAIIGAHLPRLDQGRLAKYVADEEARYVNVAVPELRAKGFLKHISDQDVRARAEEIAEEMQYELERAALFELEVRSADQPFDIASIEEAWEPAYITADGEQLLEQVGLSPSTASVYRVAFWVHNWKGTKLGGLAGIGDIPPCSPVPERLWRLAPYALVD